MLQLKQPRHQDVILVGERSDAGASEKGKITDMNSARKRRVRDRLRYYATSSHPASCPDLPARNYARRLRRLGFATGLAVVAAGMLCAWALSVLTTAAAPSTPPRSTTIRTTATWTSTGR
jgi:hypothetical protein